jgi:monoamine oxidase
VLLGFIEGQAARCGPRSRRTSGAPPCSRPSRGTSGRRARTPTDYVEKDWSGELWSRGCYVGVAPPGVLLDYGEQLRRPSGRVHWAGTETATIWNGYMEGAVRSGERVAQEVLAELPAGEPRRPRTRRRRRRRAAA